MELTKVVVEGWIVKDDRGQTKKLTEVKLVVINGSNGSWQGRWEISSNVEEERIFSSRSSELLKKTSYSLPKIKKRKENKAFHCKLFFRSNKTRSLIKLMSAIIFQVKIEERFVILFSNDTSMEIFLLFFYSFFPLL